MELPCNIRYVCVVGTPSKILHFIVRLLIRLHAENVTSFWGDNEFLSMACRRTCVPFSENDGRRLSLLFVFLSLGGGGGHNSTLNNTESCEMSIRVGQIYK